MKRFEYRKVSTLEEAIHLLKARNGKARILAGGTDLLVKMRYGIAKPEMLIDLKGIAGLDAIHYVPGEGLNIGALTSIHLLETSAVVRERFAVISQSAAAIGSFQIRCRATLGGNLCNASPAADLAPSLLALGGEAAIAGPDGTRRLPLEMFFAGPGATALRSGEIVTAVHVPDVSRQTGFLYLKHTVRNALDVPLVGVAAGLGFDPETGWCADARIVMGAVGPVPIRALNSENCLRGQKLDEALISHAALLASEEARPFDDIRGGAEYRREMVRVLTRRALKSLWENFTGGETGG